jgi:hypothetical protein
MGLAVVERCQHHAPLACAVAVILWGADASSDKLRVSARCTNCGGKGATLQRPGWADNNIGFYPFPTDIVDEMREEHLCCVQASRASECHGSQMFSEVVTQTRAARTFTSLASRDFEIS